MRALTSLLLLPVLLSLIRIVGGKKSGKKSGKKASKKESNSENSLLEALAANTGTGTLSLFPGPVQIQILEDSPNGFAAGDIVFPGQEVDQDTPFFQVEPGDIAGSVVIFGFFVPAQENTLAPRTTVQIYFQDGRRAATTLDTNTGEFRAVVTDVPFGFSPFLLTVSNPVDGDSGTILGGRRQLQEGSSYSSPLAGRIENTQQCGAPLTITLTWDGPTSDVDLHVFEPFGKRVFYGDLLGDNGAFLDFDDVNGFGPENYVAPNAAAGEDYGIQVIMYDFNSDTIDEVKWQVIIRSNGQYVSQLSGSFSFAGRDPEDPGYQPQSEIFTLSFDGGLSCEVCEFRPPASRSLQSLRPQNRKLAPPRDCLDRSMPPREFPYWCSVFPCDQNNRLEEFKFYETASQFNSKDELVNLAVAVYGPSSNRIGVASEQDLDRIIRAIQQTDLDLTCVRDVFLESWCSSCEWRRFEEVHAALNYLALIGGFQLAWTLDKPSAAIWASQRTQITSGGFKSDILSGWKNMFDQQEIERVINIYLLGPLPASCRAL